MPNQKNSPPHHRRKNYFEAYHLTRPIVLFLKENIY